MLEPFRPWLSPAYRIKFATEAWEFEAARALRRQVFCGEQGLFDGDDADGVDAYATPIVAVSTTAAEPDEVAGVVRIHEEAPRVWWGSRLAVAPRFRRVGSLGSGLIRLAVGSARALGAQEFYAHVQSQNRPLFERLDWTPLREIDLVGRPHWLMQANLEAYAPILAPGLGFSVRARAA